MMSHSYISLLLLSLIIASAGCGPKSDLQKVIVSGKVTFEVQPVGNGQIEFHPMKGTRGPVSGAPIKDGEYRAHAKGGVPVGLQKVKIKGYRARKGAADTDLISGGGTPKQYLPAKYNNQSELELEIPADQSEWTHDFELKE